MGLNSQFDCLYFTRLICRALHPVTVLQAGFVVTIITNFHPYHLLIWQWLRWVIFDRSWMIYSPEWLIFFEETNKKITDLWDLISYSEHQVFNFIYCSSSRSFSIFCNHPTVFASTFLDFLSHALLWLKIGIIWMWDWGVRGDRLFLNWSKFRCSQVTKRYCEIASVIVLFFMMQFFIRLDHLALCFFSVFKFALGVIPPKSPL